MKIISIVLFLAISFTAFGQVKLQQIERADTSKVYILVSQPDNKGILKYVEADSIGSEIGYDTLIVRSENPLLYIKQEGGYEIDNLKDVRFEVLGANVGVDSVYRGDSISEGVFEIIVEYSNSTYDTLTTYDLTGPQGDQGIQGIQGNTGDQGIQGDQGLQGDKGDAATVDLGTVITGLPGTSVLITNSGDSSAAILNFTIPQGTTGSQGPTGPQGAKGDKGNTGPTGPQGVKGDKGNTGPTGPQGAKGDKGNTGAPGATGSQGPQGAIGPQGPEGPQGDPASDDQSFSLTTGSGKVYILLSGSSTAISLTPGTNMGLVRSGNDITFNATSGSLWSQTGSKIWYNTNNVGIGTTNPQYKLDVRGTSYFGGQINVTGNIYIPSSLLDGSGSDGSSGQFLMSDGSGVYWSNPPSGGSLWSSSGSNIYRNTGNVSIGTTLGSSEKLYVAGTSYVSQGFRADGTLNGFGGVLSGYRLHVAGNMNVSGNLDVGGFTKSGGSFKIDHPLYPNTKWLYHSFVESPDMLNLYKGIDTFQSGEEVIIHLPEYFDALNKDYTYQLTPIGHFAHLYISKEVNTCIDADGDTRPCFAVHGGFKGLKFSWEVSGVRQDKWARENRIQVEVDKKVVKK